MWPTPIVGDLVELHPRIALRPNYVREQVRREITTDKDLKLLGQWEVIFGRPLVPGTSALDLQP